MTVDVRPLPRVLATVVSELELTAATYVTLAEVARIAEENGIGTSPKDLAWRLRKYGWLLPTSQRGVWEFAPGENAGPYGRGDVFAVLRGTLDQNPDLGLRVGLISALWLHGWAERAPSRHELTTASTHRMPLGITRQYRLLRFDTRLPASNLQGLPVESEATVLAHIASRPAHVSSWEAIELALPDLAERAKPDDLAREMKDRPAAAARVGYLISGVDPGLADQAGLRPARYVVRLGSGPTKRFDPHWNVADAALPFDPRKLRS